MVDFAGRHVVITGGTGALGQAVIAELLQAGATCHVPSRDREGWEHFRFLGHPDVRLATGVDLADDDAVCSFYERLPDLFASIHLAGGFAMTGIDATSEDEFQRMLQINLTTCFLCSREAVRRMRTAIDEHGGRIVNVAARPALEPRTGAGMVPYTVAKAGVAALTEALAQEVVSDGILVNAVAPSILDTPANRREMPKADHSRWPTTAEVARSIVFLASPDNAVTRGAVVPVYGRV